MPSQAGADSPFGTRSCVHSRLRRHARSRGPMVPTSFLPEQKEGQWISDGELAFEELSVRMKIKDLPHIHFSHLLCLSSFRDGSRRAVLPRRRRQRLDIFRRPRHPPVPLRCSIPRRRPHPHPR